MAVAYNMFTQHLLFTIRHAKGGNLGLEMFGNSSLPCSSWCLQARKLWNYVAW
jgi:hypothetical protein